jgi:hypothetical protein
MKAAELKQQFEKFEKSFYSAEALESVTEQYQQSGLDKDCVYFLVRKITGLIINDFIPRDVSTYNRDKLKTINDLRKIVQSANGRDLSNEEKRELTTSTTLVYQFSRGHEESVFNCLKENPSFIQNPNVAETLKQYQELAQKITTELATLIANTAFNSMSNTEKYAPDRSSNSSLVERYAQNPISSGVKQAS